MKILQIIPTLGSGGAERFVVDLCNELNLNRHEVVLCTLYNTELNANYAFFENELAQSVKRKHLNKKLGFDPKIFFRLYQTIKKVKPDVVHSHLSVINYLACSVVLLGKKVKFVHTLHGEPSKLIQNKFEKYVRALLYRRKVTPVCISESLIKSFIHLYGEQCLRPHLILNGRAIRCKVSTEIDLPILQIRNNTSAIFFLNIGRYSQEKNQLNLIAAFKKVIEKGRNDVYLIIIGDGDKQIKNQLKKYQSDKIFLLGRKNNITDYMKIADVFILPSLFEGMPISLIEAFSQGLIPMVTGVGGMNNMIKEGETGFFIKTPQVEDIEIAIESYFKLSEQEKKQIENRVKAEFETKYTINICAKKYLNLYNI